MTYDMVVEGHAFDATASLGYVYIGIEGGKIAEVSKEHITGRKHLVAPEDCIIMPGFINPHSHIREPGYTEAEDFESYGRVAAAGGITTSFDMPNNPNHPTITLERMEEKRMLSLEKAPHMDIHFMAGVAFVPDLNLDELARMLELDYVRGGKFFWEHSTGGLYQPNTDLRHEQMERAYKFMGRRSNKPAFNHCESAEDDAYFTKNLKDKSHPSVISEARPGIGETREAEKALGLGLRYDVPVVLCHGSAAGTIRIFDDFSDPKNILEAAPHHFLFNVDDFDTPARKMYPPIRREEDRIVVAQRLLTGKGVMIGTDHAPHPYAKKQGNIWKVAAGIPSDEHLGSIIGYMIKVGMPTQTAAAVSSYNAARYFGLDDRGLIEEGKRADLVVLDLKHDGRIKAPYVTRCGWSPYEGEEFGARVTHTISKGQLVFENGEVLV